MSCTSAACSGLLLKALDWQRIRMPLANTDLAGPLALPLPEADCRGLLAAALSGAAFAQPLAAALMQASVDAPSIGVGSISTGVDPVSR